MELKNFHSTFFFYFLLLIPFYSFIVIDFFQQCAYSRLCCVLHNNYSWIRVKIWKVALNDDGKLCWSIVYLNYFSFFLLFCTLVVRSNFFPTLYQVSTERHCSKFIRWVLLLLDGSLFYDFFCILFCWFYFYVRRYVTCGTEKNFFKLRKANFFTLKRNFVVHIGEYPEHDMIARTQIRRFNKGKQS